MVSTELLDKLQKIITKQTDTKSYLVKLGVVSK